MDAFEQERKLWRELRERIDGARNERERVAILNEVDAKHPGVKKFLTGLAAAALVTNRRHEVAERALALIRDPNTGASDIAALPVMDGPTVLTLCGMLDRNAVARARHLLGSKGGKKSAKVSKAKAEPWHSKCVKEARALQQQDCADRKLASTLALRFGKARETVLTVLQSAGVVPPRKKRK